MKTVGEILKEARLQKEISLSQVSRATRINEKYLIAIENDDFKSLPAAAFTKGFLQNYAKAIGLDPKVILAVFRRDFDLDYRGRIIPRELTEPVKVKANWLTPATITLVLSVGLGLLITAFFARQIIVFTAAPPLEIIEPTAQATLPSPIKVTGKTSPEAVVTINNRPVTVQSDGIFTDSFSFTPGEHTIVVTATNRTKKSRTVERVFFIEP